MSRKGSHKDRKEECSPALQKKFEDSPPLIFRLHEEKSGSCNHLIDVGFVMASLFLYRLVLGAFLGHGIDLCLDFAQVTEELV